MDILQLCNYINLQPEMKECVAAFANSFDFRIAAKQMTDFLVYENMKEARIELQKMLGNDENHIKILACMLQASANAYDIYQEKGISDEIYFATMKCYTRFIDETYKMDGRYHFDRYWWTARQAGCHLFRIGELEYEKKSAAGNMVIEIHIPSDADFSPPAVSRSFEMAKAFFAKYDPKWSDCSYDCCSWLLDHSLKNMLHAGSNILNFQDRFEVVDEGEADMEFLEWIFHTKETDYERLPVNTTLQKNMKAYLLSGGVIHNAYGRMIDKV